MQPLSRNTLAGVLKMAALGAVVLATFSGISLAENPALSTWTRNLSQSKLPQTDYNAEIVVEGSTVHTVWISRSEDWTYSLYYRRSVDHGKTWGSKIRQHRLLSFPGNRDPR